MIHPIHSERARKAARRKINLGAVINDRRVLWLSYRESNDTGLLAPEFYLKVYDWFPLLSSLCALGGAGKSP